MNVGDSASSGPHGGPTFAHHLESPPQRRDRYVRYDHYGRYIGGGWGGIGLAGLAGQAGGWGGIGPPPTRRPHHTRDFVTIPYPPLSQILPAYCI